MNVKPLPVVDHMQGALLERAADPDKSICKLQYTDRQGQWYELEMPILDALYLLNALVGVEAEAGLRQRNRADRHVILGRATKVGFSNTPNAKPLEQELAIVVEDKDDPEPWHVRLRMVDAMFVFGEIRKIAKKLGLPLRE